MRIKALLKYDFKTTIKAMVIFILIYTGCQLAATGLVSVTLSGLNSNNSVETVNYSSTIVSFVIFNVISMLIKSRRDTKFLITRSVSRREIYISDFILLMFSSAILAVLQMLSVGAIKLLGFAMTKSWNVSGDAQVFLAPDAGNLFIFFAISFAIIASAGAAAYLYGCCISRWKIVTIGITIFAAVIFMAFLANTRYTTKIFEFFKFFYYDGKTGLIVALKQLVLAAGMFAVSFPVMRRITATK